MIGRLIAIGSVLAAGVFVGVASRADDPKAVDDIHFSTLPARNVKPLEARAEERRAGIKALEKLLEAQRKELRETESNLKSARKFLAEMEDADLINARRLGANRVQALKDLLPREQATQDYLDTLNARTPEGPANSLDRRIHASELELTKRDLETIRAEIKAIREVRAVEPRK